MAASVLTPSCPFGYTIQAFGLSVTNPTTQHENNMQHKISSNKQLKEPNLRQFAKNVEKFQLPKWLIVWSTILIFPTSQNGFTRQTLLVLLA
jgi:hypothetical protein